MSEQIIKSENDLANFIIGELRADGWTCFEEVQLHRHGQIADIVAVRDGHIRVIETKMTNSLALIEQANYWTFYAHSVFVASYRFKGYKDGKNRGYKNLRGSWAFERLCRHLGLGILTVVEIGSSMPKLYGGQNSFQVDVVRAAFRRKIVKGLREILCDEMRAKGNAGTSEGKHWTPFKKTCQMLKKVVEDNPGIKLRDALAKITHHYASDSSAVQSLAKGVREGFVSGVKFHDLNGRAVLYPEHYKFEETFNEIGL